MIGDQIKKQRMARRLSQKELADMIGVSRATIGNWENNKRTLDQGMIMKIADVLKMDYRILILSDLMEDDAFLDEDLNKINVSMEKIVADITRLETIQDAMDSRSDENDSQYRGVRYAVAVLSFLILVELVLMTICYLRHSVWFS